jgi:hypothetical protein
MFFHPLVQGTREFDFDAFFHSPAGCQRFLFNVFNVRPKGLGLLSVNKKRPKGSQDSIAIYREESSSAKRPVFGLTRPPQKAETPAKTGA